MAQPHVVFMNVAATGHMNPTLPVVADLVSRGCRVTYFVDAAMRTAVEAAGAQWLPFRYAHHDFTGILTKKEQFAQLSAAERAAVGIPDDAPAHLTAFPWSAVYNAQLLLPQLLEDVQALRPLAGAIVCDPFLPCGRVVAHVLGAAPLSMLTMPGPGVMSVPSEMQEMPWVEGPRQWIRREYGVDVFADGGPLEFYSPVLNLVTTIDEFYAPPKSEEQVRRFGSSPFRCVGALLDPKVKRVENAEVPLEQRSSSAATAAGPLQAARAAHEEGRRVVLMSLGTVVTGSKWNMVLGPIVAANNGRPEGARSLTEYTGKDFCLFAYRAFFEAAARDPDTLVIVSMGPHRAEALGELPEPPPNVVVCESVPQLQLLPLCDAFVTHGGANSMHEALAYGVPLCVVPIFGDQPTNADTLARIGAGASFRDPLLTLSGDSLSGALRGALADGAGNPFRAAAAPEGPAHDASGPTTLAPSARPTQ